MFNASAEPRTDVVRVPLEGFPPWRVSVTRFDMHPLGDAVVRGRHCRRPPRAPRAQRRPDARQVPAGSRWARRRVRRARRSRASAAGDSRWSRPRRLPTRSTTGAEIESAGDRRVASNDDGTLSITLGGRTYDGLFGIEDAIDRGDSYDCDPDPVRDIRVRFVTVRRTRHPSGIERLRVVRELDAIGPLTVEACVAPGVPFVRCEVTLDNRAPDHRLRLRFPTGAAVDTFDAATTFDVAQRSTAPVDDTGWVHPASAHVRASRLDRGERVWSSARPDSPRPKSRPAARYSSRSSAASARCSRHRTAHPTDAGRARDDGAGRTSARSYRRDGDAGPLRRPTSRAAEVGLRGVLAGDTPLLASRRFAPRARGRGTRCCRRASPRWTAIGSSCAS